MIEQYVRTSWHHHQLPGGIQTSPLPRAEPTVTGSGSTGAARRSRPRRCAAGASAVRRSPGLTSSSSMTACGRFRACRMRKSARPLDDPGGLVDQAVVGEGRLSVSPAQVRDGARGRQPRLLGADLLEELGSGPCCRSASQAGGASTSGSASRRPVIARAARDTATRTQGRITSTTSRPPSFIVAP